MNRRDACKISLAAAALMCGTLAAHADYPEKPIRVVVPFSAGGATDSIARSVSQVLSERINQPVTIDNVTGGGTVIGTQEVINAAPDGYTLLFHSGTLAIDITYKPNNGYDVREDLVPITKAAWGPFAVLVRPDLEITTLAELKDYTDAHPGELNFGSGGTGTMIHLASEYLWAESGIQVTHVPYRGEGPATAALLSGEIDVLLKPPFTSTELLADNKVVALAVTAKERSPLMPETPTVIETGLEDVAVGHWGGFFAPAGTPDDIISFLNTELVAAMGDPRIKEQLGKSGLFIIADSPSDFRKEIEEEIGVWKKVITEAKIPTQ
ncbi:Bug family tripartite tricarboxylate transporter substrate binding protein [Acuticoccus kandeliae]|uniref:Bug family tripartite tricarboxylate transporter substrate binding protein n=1 Tax=Acuticoccus kandeliae TaxID=2073160 RepID=UPI0013007555|nr:tripartite tricarboxylate transporter substrate binding protein [Acuticoccus kandeliae]